MVQEKHPLLVDSGSVIEYASEKIREPAKTVKNHLMAPLLRIIKFTEDP